jgi:hypothetical protein
MGQQVSRQAAPSSSDAAPARMQHDAQACEAPQQGSADHVPVTDRIRIEFRSRHEQLLAAEKELRGRLYAEYMAQLKDFEPTLRLRGEM